MSAPLGEGGFYGRIGGLMGVEDDVEDDIERGTRVKLKAEAFGYTRPHLLWHARQGDVGLVSGPSKQSPAMSRLYTIVHFEQCGHDHRLQENELEVVA